MEQEERWGQFEPVGALRTLTGMWGEGKQRNKRRARGKVELTHPIATEQETDGFPLF